MIWFLSARADRGLIDGCRLRRFVDPISCYKVGHEGGAGLLGEPWSSWMLG